MQNLEKNSLNVEGFDMEPLLITKRDMCYLK